VKTTMWPHERPETHFTSHRLILENLDHLQVHIIGYNVLVAWKVLGI